MWSNGDSERSTLETRNMERSSVVPKTSRLGTTTLVAQGKATCYNHLTYNLRHLENLSGGYTITKSHA